MDPKKTSSLEEFALLSKKRKEGNEINYDQTYYDLIKPIKVANERELRLLTAKYEKDNGINYVETYEDLKDETYTVYVDYYRVIKEEDEEDKNYCYVTKKFVDSRVYTYTDEGLKDRLEARKRKHIAYL